MDPHRESSSLKVVQEGSDGITLPRPLHTTTTLQFARFGGLAVGDIATRVLCLIETRSLFLFPVPVPPLIHARSFSRPLYAARPPLCMN
ncbi:hypothetical protein HBI60_053390 [Parastagonospora nodorum]|nr:hypothetical protein HBI60_053390 [Parastagonospora nodorum]